MEASRVAFALVALIGMIGLFKPIARLKMAHRWHAFAWLAVGLIGTAAVGPKPQQTSVSKPVATGEAKSQPEPQAIEPPPPPAPPYASIDGDEYLYSAGISKDAEDAGQVAGEFMAFRYRGLKEGKIMLTSKGMTLRCDQVCKVITVTDQFGSKQHIEYTPDSVAGAAFTDAMNGLLVEWPSLKKLEGGK